MTPTTDEIKAHLAAHFPQAEAHKCELLEVDSKQARVRLHVTDAALRPGGIVSGPAIMALMDLAMFCVALANTGLDADAVTTHMSIDYVRAAAPKDLIGVATCVKAGSRTIVGQVSVLNLEGAVIAQSMVTYAIVRRGASPAAPIEVKA